jgi:hypothetical protein
MLYKSIKRVPPHPLPKITIKNKNNKKGSLAPLPKKLFKKQ